MNQAVRSPHSNPVLWGGGGVAVLVIAFVVIAYQSSSDDGGTVIVPRQTRDDQPVTEAAVRKSCTGCHAFPEPTTLPRDAWRTHIGQMQSLPNYQAKATVKLPLEGLVAWFEERAIDEFELPAGDSVDEAVVSRFRRHILKHPAPSEPAISHVQFFASSTGGKPRLVACDMRHGSVLIALSKDDRQNHPGGLRELAKSSHPSRLRRADLNRDGRFDFLVANLGSFVAIDHNLGRIDWLREPAPGEWSLDPLIEGLARVADAQTADFDGDGDDDIVVAEFGWRTTGRVAIFENKSRGERRSFHQHTVDPRHGAVEVSVVDLNKDGRLDFVGMLAQEHEEVVVYLNEGDFRFTAHELYSAPHPAWGFSGFELVDLDQDGDEDILIANGDMFDDARLKPYHGVSWLENTGDLEFELHPLVAMYGAHRPVAADLDDDGDLDVVASALAQPGGDLSVLETLRAPALIWLEQVSPGEFESHVLEIGSCHHATLDVADWDADGDLDIAVGHASIESSGVEAWVTIWENEGLSSP